jgi:hypothetical protein
MEIPIRLAILPGILSVIIPTVDLTCTAGHLRSALNDSYSQ